MSKHVWNVFHSLLNISKSEAKKQGGKIDKSIEYVCFWLAIKFPKALKCMLFTN